MDCNLVAIDCNLVAMDYSLVGVDCNSVVNAKGGDLAPPPFLGIAMILPIKNYQALGHITDVFAFA